MLVVSGSKVEQIDKIAQVELEREILQKKQLSPVLYHYDTLEALKFELKMRIRIVESAKVLNNSGARFTPFKSSQCNPQFWSRTANGGFLLKSGVLPSEGINDIYQNGNLYGFECSTAIVILLYKAILDMVSKEIFNAYFKGLFLFDWNLDSDLRLVKAESKSENYPGDIRYFENPDHDPAMPQWQGENVITLGDDLYYGHGIGIATAATIISALNTKRKPAAVKSAFLTDHIVHPDFEYLRELAISRKFAEVQNHLTAKQIIVRIGSSIYIC